MVTKRVRVSHYSRGSYTVPRSTTATHYRTITVKGSSKKKRK